MFHDYLRVIRTNGLKRQREREIDRRMSHGKTPAKALNSIKFLRTHNQGREKGVTHGRTDGKALKVYFPGSLFIIQRQEFTFLNK